MLIAVFYPAFIFLSINYFDLPTRVIAIVIFCVALVLALLRRSLKAMLPSAVLSVIAIIVFITDNESVLKFYPVFINTSFLVLFLVSVDGDKSIIYSFAELGYRNLPHNPSNKAVRRYCLKVTYIWCCFFVLNAVLSLILIIYGSMEMWAFYTGFLSYVLMGCLFAVEFIVRCFVNAGFDRRVAFTETKADSRDAERVICFYGNYDDGNHRTWNDYLRYTANVRSFLSTVNAGRVILHADDFWLFLVCFTAILQSGKTVAISANNSEGFIREILDEGSIFLSDTPCSYGYHIADAISMEAREDHILFPSVDPSCQVEMFTSGSTGKPKVIRHSIIEIEKDSEGLEKKWIRNIRKRLVVSTVNPHHDFGLIFAVLRPFMLGVQFRAERINDPEGFLDLAKDEYIIVSTPSFLKTAALDPDLQCGNVLKNPYFMVAGGPLYTEDAAMIDKVLGSWPFEIYGSTETGAVAWRISKGQEEPLWTPIGNLELSVNSEGCLVASGPAVIGGGSFSSSDLVELKDDGRFLLLGRKDSVVKIAEKRISLLEVQSRIRQTGLVDDIVVVKLSDEKREYLAAAAVLNEEGQRTLKELSHGGKVKFLRSALSAYMESVTIPRRWRFVDRIPVNSMGKIQMNEVVGLFEQDV